MSWISDLKAQWQRFEQWERFAILREKKWRFPVQGTTEAFERRFGDLVPQVPRDEFFRLYKKRKTPGTFGFCADDEVVLKTPNPPPSGVKNFPTRRQRSIYYFHGQLKHGPGGSYLYGHFRLPMRVAKGCLGMINGFMYAGATGLLLSAIGYGIGLLTGAAMAQFIVFIFVFYLLPIFTPIYVFLGLIAWLLGRHLERHDQPARAETYRLLTEICGSARPQETTV